MKGLKPIVVLSLSAAVCGYPTSPYGTRIIAGVIVPDTPTITKAISYARENGDDHTFNHVMRSWLVGQASIARLPANITEHVDLEVFAVAAILHDLGWSNNSALISTDKRFEVDGAISAREFLRIYGEGDWNERRTQLVWDAIALHASPDFALYKEKEVWMTSAGITSELVSPEVTIKTLGPERVAVTMEEWDNINKEFPRSGLKDYLKSTLVRFCATKAESTYGTFMADYGEAYLPGYFEQGHRAFDFFEANVRD
jgi:hypothetical protein